MGYYLTYDFGTTALKTALVADDGRVAAVHSEGYSDRAPRPDWAEMPPETYWRAMLDGTGRVLALAGARGADVTAIGLSSQGQTVIPIDAAGRPLHDAIVWLDRRASPIAREWEEEWLPSHEFRRVTGYPWVACELTAFKIAWLTRNKPETRGAWRFLCLPDFIVHKLTGEAATDYTIALMTGTLDLESQAWQPRIVSAAGIEESQLPTVFAPGTVAGQLRPGPAAELGLRAGTPVCVGANDQLAGAVGAGNVHPGVVTETTGTALALVVTLAERVDDDRVCVGRHPVPECHYALSFANNSGVVLQWLRDLCAPGQEYAEFLAGVDRIAPGCDGLTMLPHFSGTGMPRLNPQARGAFDGLTLAHTRDHLARAVMEACACELQECLEPLQALGIRMDSIRSLGGAAKSDVWLQMKTDMLGTPVERPACPHAASLGAAMLAAKGVGQFRSVPEAADAWYRPADRFEPNPGRREAYREVYERYAGLYERLYGHRAPA